MVGILGSLEWVQDRGMLDEHEAKRFLSGYLRYALTTDPGLTHIVVRKGDGDFDIDGRIVSRCEVALAFHMLPRAYRLAVWDRVVKQRPDYELAIAYGVAARTVRWRVQQGLGMMVRQVFDELQTGHCQS